MKSRNLIAFLSATLLFTLLSGQSISTAQASLPNPVLAFRGQESYETGGKSWTRYRYAIENFKDYPAELFAPAPSLPPCGANTRAARTWLDFYDQRGKRLYGFCALSSSKDAIWFALAKDIVPP
jgi:hypothetical protein